MLYRIHDLKNDSKGGRIYIVGDDRASLFRTCKQIVNRIRYVRMIYNSKHKAHRALRAFKTFPILYIPVLGIKKIIKLFFLHRTKEKRTLLCKMNFYSFYPLSFPFFSFLCIKVTRETFNDVITRTWRPFRIVIRFFTIKDRSDVRSSGSSSPDTIATLPLSSCSAIIHARDLKDSFKDQRTFLSLAYDFEKSEELKVSIRSNMKYCDIL